MWIEMDQRSEANRVSSRSKSRAKWHRLWRRSPVAKSIVWSTRGFPAELQLGSYCRAGFRPHRLGQGNLLKDSVRNVLSTHTSAQPGYHALRFWMVAPGVVLQSFACQRQL
jgi:hypothetical protein